MKPLHWSLAYVKSDARFPMFWRCVFHDLTKCYQHTQFTQSKEITVSLEHKSDHKICVKALTSQSGQRKHPCILSMGRTILTSKLWVWAKDWTQVKKNSMKNSSAVQVKGIKVWHDSFIVEKVIFIWVQISYVFVISDFKVAEVEDKSFMRRLW